MADRRHKPRKDAYSKGLTDDLRVTDSVNMPLKIPLTPEFVRDLVDDPDAEKTQIERAEQMWGRGDRDKIPDSLMRKVFERAKSEGSPTTAWDKRSHIWLRAVAVLMQRFGLKRDPATRLVAENGRLGASYEAVKKAINRHPKKDKYLPKKKPGH